MNYDNIKFRLNIDVNEYSIIYDVFKELKTILNWQFDEDFNAFKINKDIDYQVKDISNLTAKDIEEIINNFLDFNFKDIINVPLYKFLVLKNNKKLIILANINSLIFDYSSINDFYQLFSDLNNFYPKNDLKSYYNNVNDYLNSVDFKKDSKYWENFILNSSNYIRFHNIKENNYKNQIINVDNKSVLNFIKTHNCSLFDFYGSLFSLYLSRSDRLDGCLLKTIIPREKSNSEIFDKNTFLRIDIDKSDTFEDLLNKFNTDFRNNIDYSKVDVDNYTDDYPFFYSIYDFNDFNENITVYTGENSALTLNICKNHLVLVYNSDLFSDVYVEHMVKNIKSLMNNVLNSPTQTIYDIDILSNEEKSLLSDFCKGKTVEVDKDKYLSHSFRENVLKYPDTIVIDDGVNKITFKELDKSSNSIAHDLRENYGIGLESRVALMLPRTYHVPELMLALNKIGATFIPVDLFYPVKRIEYMLTISQSKYIVTTKEIANSFDLNVEMICIEDLNDSADVDVDIVTRGDDLFTIIFTSGTTGFPKGVMVSNRQLACVAISFREIFNYSQGDVIGHYLGFTFVASFVIYAALIFGGCCRIFNEKEQKDSLLLIKELKENHMNSLILPPSVGIPIFENEDLDLDYLVLAGAKLNELSKKERHTKIINFYGTTEIICGITNIYDLKNITGDSVPVGKPVANTNIYILDKNNNQMPIGVPGEICVSNDYISPGYLDNPELTNQVFVENPYSDCEDNKRMYKTGDIGFYNFDGEIEILGREDDQLSVRGFRVESDEILTIMKQFNEISDIYIDVDNDTLIAYYTTSDDIDINTVKEALKINLPDYMIPSLFIELEKIPLNINGKIDKTTLKKMVSNNEDTEVFDETLRSVVDGFKEVLNLDSVLIDDDFIELGGNSLSAMKLQLLLKEKLNAHLSSNELMELSTPKDIADFIKFNLKNPPSIDINKYTFDEACPLSESQLNVYLDEAVNEMGTGYNNPFKIELNNDYSVDEIKKALIKLIEVFPVLKARIINETGEPRCIFDAELEIIEGSLNDIESFVRPFELDKNLSRFLIINEGKTVILCCDVHHLIFDGTSFGVLFNRLYSILKNEESDFVDEGMLKQISFEEDLSSDYEINAQKFFDEMLSNRDEVYDLLPSIDTEKLNDIQESNDTNNEHSYKKDSQTSHMDDFELDTNYLSSFLQEHHITHNQFFASVFAYTLSRFTGSSKVLFNLLEDGRGHIDLSHSVGMFVKTLPIIIDCENQDIKSYLNHSSHLINSAMKYDLYPYHILANEYDLNSNILFQYSHNIFYNALKEEKFGFKVDELNHDLNSELSFSIFNLGEDRFAIEIGFSEKYSKSFIKQIINTYKLILKEILHVDRLDKINYTDDENLKILDSFNETSHPLDSKDILMSFNNNLAKYPDEYLVTYKDNKYTYAEGAFIADKIAKKLIDLGVESQDCIAFLVERSELYMFPILGILSIGGIYVPLDDAHPDDRIQFILKDTESKAIIVSDKTYERASNLDCECTLLNVSDILNDNVDTLSALPVVIEDLACILYTSGSTGIPKGVKITRKSIVNVVEFYVNEYNLNHSDVYGLFSAIGFDVSNFIIGAVLYSGACLSVVPEDIRHNMIAMNEYFINHGVTHAFITTQVGKLFMQSVKNTSLDFLLVAGEKLGKVENPKDYELVDAYGPTEAFAFMSSINNSEKIVESSVGYLNYNTNAYILDDELRRVPIGAVGELCLAGYQIADGYLNREEETSHAFIVNPFDDDVDYDVLYRTGDMVRMLPDGSLGIIGRRDGQVKVRGNRLELLEVEAEIRQLDYVTDVTVQITKNGENNELVAYVVSEQFNEDNLRDRIQMHMSKSKPDYMVPSFVIKLDEIPLNVNGKLDKNALPAVDRTILHEEFVAARNEKEKWIVEAFEKVFNLENASIYDDFIRLGGDSLTAIKLLSHIKFGNLTMVDILNLRTPEAIAKNIDDLTFDLDIYSLESGCPLNSAQINVLADVTIYNKSNAYHIPNFIKIPKKYSLEEILNALDKLLDAHPILGTHLTKDYEVNDTNYVTNSQLLKDSISIAKKFGIKEIMDIVNSYGLRNINGLYNMLGTAMKLLKGEYPYIVKGQKPPIFVESTFDKEILIDFVSESLDIYTNMSKFMVMESENSYYLFFVIHHMIFDASSLVVFNQDFQTLLDGGSIELDDTFLKVSAFTHQIKNTKKFDEASEFYNSMLADVEEAEDIPEDNSSNGYRRSYYNLDIDKNKLQSFLKNTGVSENVLFTSVFAYTISKFVTNDKVLFTMIENGRDRFNGNFIDMTSNVMPLLIDCKDQSIDSFIENTANIVYGAMNHSYYPILLLYQKYNFEVKILFQFLPNAISYEIEDIEGISSLEITNQVLNSYEDFLTELFVQIEQHNENYKLAIINSNKYSDKKIEDFKETYILILSNIINVDISSNLSNLLKENFE